MEIRNPHLKQRDGENDGEQAIDGLSPGEFESRLQDAADDLDRPDSSLEERDRTTKPTCGHCGKQLLTRRQKDSHEPMCPENPANMDAEPDADANGGEMSA